jgi:phosphatidylglycerophosphate synthase
VSAASHPPAARPARPTIAELRSVCQPPSIRGRRTAEHWVGDLYQRRISPYVTRELVRLGFTANAVTWLMIVTGWSSALVLLVPGPAGGLLCPVLTQLQMLWDASDGEVARWRSTSSPFGVFLDKVGHYTTEALIPLLLGVRAAGGIVRVLVALRDGGPAGSGAVVGWTTLGAVLALLIVLNKALNDMVHVARAAAGLERLTDDATTAAPRPGLVATARRAARFVPFHRLYHSIELSLLVLVATVGDLLTGSGAVTRALLAVLVVTASLSLVGHFLVIASSRKLRA